MIYCCRILLTRHMASKPAALLFGQIALAAVLGAGLAIGVQAIALAANGGSWVDDTVAKVGQGGRSSRRLQSCTGGTLLGPLNAPGCWQNAACLHAKPCRAPASVHAPTASVQAGALLALSSPVVVVLTVLRFRSPALGFPMLFATLVFAMSGEAPAGPAAACACGPADRAPALLAGAVGRRAAFVLPVAVTWRVIQALVYQAVLF